MEGPYAQGPDPGRESGDSPPGTLTEPTEEMLMIRPGVKMFPPEDAERRGRRATERYLSREAVFVRELQGKPTIRCNEFKESNSTISEHFQITAAIERPTK